MPTRRDVVMVASRALAIQGAQTGARVARYIDFVLYSGSEHAPEIQNQRCEAMDWLRGQRFVELAPGEQEASSGESLCRSETARGSTKATCI